ncbi:MAG: alkaline phosphatase, partial [Bacteroidetes bacterium]|nr:alkaline phosphatase [Bacteroidota bacterium]
MLRRFSLFGHGLVLALLLWIFSAPDLTAQTAESTVAEATAESPRNIILFIADGCGPASYTMARDYRRYKGLDAPGLDQYQTGSIRTFASNSRVTDSAAGATAFSAGVKTYNGAIAVDTLKRPVATILEAAEQRGKSTGLVATSRITHATPATFSAHVADRGEEAIIAEQQLGQGIEVLLGGGRGWFRGRADDGWRDDGRNLMDEAASQGYTVVQTKAAFDDVMAPPLLGLFTDSHMAYEIDRDPADEPSLAEMTTKAIDLLDDDRDGFFLMVEGSRIDHAGHGNDAAAHLHDILAFQDAVQAALRFADADGETLVVVTSDHE